MKVDRELMIHSIERRVGLQVRQRRWQLGLTLAHVASAVGVSCQQLQKYETGSCRISVDRLWHIAAALDVPVSYFFEGLPQIGAADGGCARSGRTVSVASDGEG